MILLKIQVFWEAVSLGKALPSFRRIVTHSSSRKSRLPSEHPNFRCSFILRVRLHTSEDFLRWFFESSRSIYLKPQSNTTENFNIQISISGRNARTSVLWSPATSISAVRCFYQVARGFILLVQNSLIKLTVRDSKSISLISILIIPYPLCQKIPIILLK